LLKHTPAEHDADDAFAHWCEDVWQGLAEFRRKCRLRTWLYVLARNARARNARQPHRQTGRNVPLSQVLDLPQLCVEVRTSARERVQQRDRLAELRMTLTEREQMLITLRVD